MSNPRPLTDKTIKLTLGFAGAGILGIGGWCYGQGVQHAHDQDRITAIETWDKDHDADSVLRRAARDKVEDGMVSTERSMAADITRIKQELGTIEGFLQMRSSMGSDQGSFRRPEDAKPSMLPSAADMPLEMSGSSGG